MNHLVKVSDLHMVADNGFAIDVAQLHLSPGETVALVGQNGSGKSTLLETVLGLRKRGSGTCLVLGEDWRERACAEIRARVGAQLHGLNQHPMIRVSELIAIYRSAYGFHDPEFAALLSVSELARKLYGKLSKGERQRIDLFLAIAHRPELVFLDEPTSGLDRGFQARFQAALIQLREKFGSAIIMATHHHAEVELADRIVWLGRGQVIADAPREQLLGDTVGMLHANFKDAGLPLAELTALSEVINVRKRIDGTMSVFARQNAEQVLIDFFRERGIHYFSLAPSGVDDFLSLITEEDARC